MNERFHEPISVVFNSEGAIDRFHWRGRAFRIEVIERVWRSALRGSASRRLYRVRASRQAFVLCHDLDHKRWTVVRAPWRLQVQRAFSGWAQRWATVR